MSSVNAKQLLASFQEKWNNVENDVDDKLSLLQKKINAATTPESKFAKSGLTVLKLEENLRKEAEDLKCKYNEILAYAQKQKALRLEIRNLKNRNESMLRAVEGLEEYNKKEQEKLQSLKQDLENENKDIMEKLAPLRTTNDLYKTFLGLDIDNIKENTLMFTFKNVARNNPDQLYTFSLDIKDNNYIVTKCDPDLPNLEKIMQKLNTDNNFGQFIVEMRKQFSNSEKSQIN